MLKKNVMLCACALFASGISCMGSTVSERMFLWNEANSMMASARSPEEHLMAAQVYRNMADKGIRNGPVFYNLGTALLNAGVYDGAIESFLRAERYMGSRPDLVQNLAIAFARKAGTADHQIQWYRIPLFWHFRLSTPVRTLLAAMAFCLSWIFTALRKLGAGRWTRIASVISLAVFLLFGSSVATSLHQEANARRGIHAAVKTSYL